jgi:hypothetical protein
MVKAITYRKVSMHIGIILNLLLHGDQVSRKAKRDRLFAIRDEA